MATEIPPAWPEKSPLFLSSLLGTSEGDSSSTSSSFFPGDSFQPEQPLLVPSNAAFPLIESISSPPHELKPSKHLPPAFNFPLSIHAAPPSYGHPSSTSHQNPAIRALKNTSISCSGDALQDESCTGENLLKFSRVLLFPSHENRRTFCLFRGKVRKNSHEITLSAPGYFGIYLMNQSNPTWKNTFLGSSRAPIVMEYTLCSPKGFPLQGKTAESESLHASVQSILSPTNRGNYSVTHSSTKDLSSILEGFNEKFPFSSRNREECSLRLKSSGKLIIYSQQFQYVYIVADKPDLLLKLTVFNKRALGASPLCEYSIFYCGKPEKISRNPSVAFLRSPAILTLDGGGVLGLSSLKILERLEYELQREVGNSKARLVDCFDLLAGTSTGGIIALGLLSGKSILEMIEMWSDMSSSIFEGSRSVFSGIFFEGYDVSNMKRVLLQSLGDQLLTAYKHPYCFVTTMDVKHNPYQLFLLRNYEHPRAGSNGQQHRGLSTFPIWAAGWATGAAPTYLKGPHADDIENMGFCIEPKVHLVDGAMKVNNPAMVALEEAARMTDKSVAHFIEEDLDLLVSVGTGQEPIRLTQSNSSSKASTLEIILNAGHLLTSTNFTHREVLNLMADTEGTYWRFNTPYIGQIPLDCNDSLQIDLIAKATSSYLMDEKFFDIKRLAKLLANRVLMK